MSHLKYVIDDWIAIIRFNRPEKKNAISPDIHKALTASLTKANADAKFRAVFTAGTGDAFTSGNDITNFRERTGREEGGEAEKFMLSIVNSEKPLVAAVNGVAIGVDATIFLNCELVCTSHNATIKMPFVSLGFCSEFASNLTLLTVMGMQRVSDMLLLRDAINALKAMEFGFVNAVYELNQLHEMALSSAKRIAQQPPESVRKTREFLPTALRPNYVHCLIEKRRMITKLLGSLDAQRAFEGFYARRGSVPVAAA